MNSNHSRRCHDDKFLIGAPGQYGCTQMYMRLKVMYTYQSYWNVFLREKSWRRIATYRAASILQSSHLQWHVIIKTLVTYLDVILLIVSQTSTSDSPDSLYLKIFGFIRYDFWCFRDKAFSIQYTEEFVSFDFKVHKKELLRQILRYSTPGSTYYRTMFIRKVLFYCFQYIYHHRLLKEHFIYTLSGRIGKVVASHAAVARSSQLRLH